MILYVIRHAEAIEGSTRLPDEWRYLTKQGRSIIKKMRTKILKHGPEPRLLITSPLVRAVQTAEIFAEKYKQKEVMASGLLEPDASIHQLIKNLKSYAKTRCVMIVGHEPFLSLLVIELLDQKNNPITLKKGSCVALKLDFNKNKTVMFSIPAFAGFWCNGSDSAVYCRPDDRPAYWCTGSSSAKYCRPEDAPGFWCTGSGSALYCRPENQEGYWCTGSASAYYCHN